MSDATDSTPPAPTPVDGGKSDDSAVTLPTTDTWNARVEAAFSSAMEHTPGNRTSWVEQTCGHDRELRERVLCLVQAHERAGLVFEEVVSPELQYEFLRLKPEEPGDHIGPYQLLEQIGEGGFGTVWLAEQKVPVRRRVALKILKLGMDTKEVLARFEQERQALAMMDHTGIAKVFDAGATQYGRPFIVMEFVAGAKITTFCDQHHLGLTERLELFVEVCQAVQHAHQKGVIHRDLKPSNVLVALEDGLPVPKVIDFGVAKAVQQRLSDLTVHTQFEQMIGTPPYMSPEQAEASGLNVDTRTDIYALGVLLYELLTGRTPFDTATLLEAGYEEMRQIIREREAPKPSTALHTMGRDALTSVARHRSSEPLKLTHAVRGDLDWIVMKALEKDRSRRYETANGFALDVQRHVRCEPVVARPPSRSYRFGRFIRRNRQMVAVGIVVLASLIAGIIGTSLGLLRARQERDTAQRRLHTSLLGEARATQLARIDGYRPKVEALLRRAGQLEIDDVDQGEIRQQAVDCMGDFVGLPPLSISVARSQITAITLHPQLPLIAVGMMDGGILFFDIQSGKEWASLAKHKAAVVELEFETFGTRLISVDAAGAVVTWSQQTADSWTADRTVLIAGQISKAALAPDSGRVVSLHPSGVVAWDLETGETLNRTRELGGAVALSFGGDLLAAFGSDGLTTFNTRTAETRRLAPNQFGPMKCVAFNRDSSLLAYGCDEGLVVVEMPSGNQRMSVRSDAQHCVAFHPRRPLLATGSITSQIRLWNVATNREEATVEFSGGGLIRHLAFRADGKYLAASKEGSIRIWNVDGTDERTLLAGHAAGVSCSAYSPDGTRLATGGKDRSVKIWDTSDGRLVQSLDDFPAYVQTIAFHPRLPILATGDYAGRIQLWDWAAKRLITQHRNDVSRGREIYRVAFSPDGNFLAASSSGLEIWRLSSTSTAAGIEHEEVGVSLDSVAQVAGARSLMLCFSADSSKIAWLNKQNEVCLWDIAAAMPLPFSGPKALNGWQGLAFLPDGGQLAYVSDQSVLQVWDVSTDRSAFTLGQPGDFPGWHVAVSPDGRWLLGESSATTPALWNLRNRKRMLLLPHSHSPVWTFAWSPQSDGMAIGLSDGSASIWHLPEIRSELESLGLGWTDAEFNSSMAVTPALQNNADAALVKLVGAGTPVPSPAAAKYASTEEKAKTALARRRFAEAVELYRELIKLSSEHGQSKDPRPAREALLANALLLRGNSEQAQGSTERAVDAFREAGELIGNLALERVSLAEGAARVDLFSRHGHWKEAARLGRPLYNALPGNPWPALRLAPLLIEEGSIAEYEKLCGELVSSFVSGGPQSFEAQSASVFEKYGGNGLDIIAKAVCLRPVSGTNLEWADKLANKAASLVNERNHAWYQFTKGLAAYRGGDYAAAAHEMKNVIPRLPAVGEVAAQAVMAMANAALKKPEQAQAALSEGSKLLNANWVSEARIALNGDPHDWLIAHILLQEAKTVVDARK